MASNTKTEIVKFEIDGKQAFSLVFVLKNPPAIELRYQDWGSCIKTWKEELDTDVFTGSQQVKAYQAVRAKAQDFANIVAQLRGVYTREEREPFEDDIERLLFKTAWSALDDTAEKAPADAPTSADV